MAELKNINGPVNIVGEIEATSLDINGNADVSGVAFINSGTTNVPLELGSSDAGCYIRYDDGDNANRWYAGVNAGSFGIYNNSNVKVLGLSGTQCTISGELEASSLDINGNANISGALSMAPSTSVPINITGTNSTYTAIAIKNTGTGDAGIYFDAMNGDLGGSDYAFVGQKEEGELLYDIGVNSTNPVHKFTGGHVGIGITPVSTLHVYENSTETSQNAGITVENDGNGDATVQFLLTGIRRWATGIDHSDSDKFKIASSGDLGSDAKFTLDTSGNATFAGTITTGNRITLSSGGNSTSARIDNSGNYLLFQAKDSDTSKPQLWMGNHSDTGFYVNASNFYFRQLNSTNIATLDSSRFLMNGEIEATSLDINGNGDVSGTLNVTGSITTTGAGVNGNLYANRYIQNATGVPTNNLGAPTVTEMALFEQQFKPQTTLANNYDNLADLKFYKQDTSGSSWTEITSYSDDQKRKFLRTMNSSVIIPNTTYKFRVEFVAHGYTFANAVSSYWSSNSHNTQVHVWKKRCSDNLWQQHTSSTTTVSSWPGHMYLPFGTIAWHETNTTSTGHHNAIRIEFTPNWIAYSGTGTDYSANNINIYGLQIWGGYPSGRRTVHSYDQNGKLSLFGDLYTPTNIDCLGTIYNASWDGDVIPSAKLDADTMHMSVTQTVGGQKTFSNHGNHLNGHLYFDAYDTNGNHYPHFLDGSGNTGTTINWRQYYGSNKKTHTWASDASGNMVFTYQGDIKAVGELEGTSLDINGNADISGHLSVDTVTNSTVDLDKFLVIDSGNRIYYRTGAQVLSDIGAGTGSSNGDVTLAGAQTFTGAKTFSAFTSLQQVSINGPSAFTANAVADDLIIGDGTASRGLTIFSSATGLSSVYFADDLDTEGAGDNPVGSRDAKIEYSHANGEFNFRTGGNQQALELKNSRASFEGHVSLNDSKELIFGTSDDVKMTFDGSDLVTTVPTGSAFMIGTNGGTPHDNSGKADFVVDVNDNPQISFYSNQFQVGSTDMNWNAFLRYDGNTKLAAWNNDMYIYTQGSGSDSAKNVYIRPQAAGGGSTTVATFNGDNGTTLTGAWSFGDINGGSFKSYTYGTELDISSLNSGGWARAHRIITSDSSGQVFFGVLGNNTTTTRAYWTLGDPDNMGGVTGYNSSNGVVLLKDGKVGIGTTSPSAKLDVNGEVQATSLDINGNADISGTLNIHDEIITTAGGSLFEMYKSSWSNATNHDVLYSGWNTNTDDFIYLKSPGNSTNNHGIAFIGDNVIAFGRTNAETGNPELTSAAAPLNDNWLVLNTTSATFAGDVTINGSHLKLLNHSGSYEGAATDYLYIGGSGLDGTDAAIYLGNAGDNTGYGWRFYYAGSGSGNDNKLIIKSENAGSGVDALSFTQDGNATFGGELTIPSYIHHAGDSGTKFGFEGNDAFRLYTASTMQLQIDSSGDATFASGVTVSGNLAVNGTITVGANDTGHDVFFYGATSGKYLKWDESADCLFFPDDTSIKFGNGNDARIYVSSDDLLIQQDTADKDIRFLADNGSGQATEYFRLDGGGELTYFSKHLQMADNAKFFAGSSGDLQIYHNGSHSYVDGSNGAGSLYIRPGTGNTVQIENSSGGDMITASGGGAVNLYYNAVKKFETVAAGVKTSYAATSSTDGDHAGDIVYFGTTSVTPGKIYYYTSSGQWELADADAESTAKGLLGVGLGETSADGMLIRGMVTLDTDPGTRADTLFLSTTAGAATSTAPSGSGDIVRVIGYCLDSTNGQVYFNPDGAFVEVTAGG